MALLVALVAGLLVVAESQASEKAGRSDPQGFLSKYLPFGSDGLRIPFDSNDKFITSNLKHMKYRNKPDLSSHHTSHAEHGVGTDGIRYLDVLGGYGRKAVPNMGERSSTALHDNPISPTAQAQNSMGVRAASEESLISSKDFDLPKTAAEKEKKASQKLLFKGNNTSITLIALGVGLLTLAMLLGFRIRKRMQPAAVLGSSGALGWDMSANTASGLGDNLMELESQSSSFNGAAAREMKHPHKETSRRVGWGQLSSQNSRQPTLCYATAPGEPAASVSTVQDMPVAVANGSDGDTPARVLWLAGDGDADTYGAASPAPRPPWARVAKQLAARIGNMDPSVIGMASAVGDAAATDTETAGRWDVVLGLGVTDAAKTEELLARVRPTSFVADGSCSEAVRALSFCGQWTPANPGAAALTRLVPWTKAASRARLLAQTESLLARGSSEDALFAALFLVHALVRDVAVVRSDINPSWEKGVLRNAQEFKTMVDCCGTEIFAAMSDPQTKSAIDALNAVDLRDQVGSYRVIVSNETPQLEDFTLCILQQNNCFNSDAPILDRPCVPVLGTWRGAPLDDAAASQVFIGHLDDPAAASGTARKPWSWKIVIGANPAYDAFPMQHQIFYPPAKKTGSKSLWYDPVFCVETLAGELIWTKRHYRCAPRGGTPGLWTLTTLDNGIISEEHWTTVDAADDLSWAVFHYSGAARRAGQSYQGALLCSEDGAWPDADPARIEAAINKCGLELWEMYGFEQMWSPKFTDWAAQHPPPLDRIGDQTIAAWRKQEREKARAAQELARS
jgi:hypothetical protein